MGNQKNAKRRKVDIRTSHKRKDNRGVSCWIKPTPKRQIEGHAENTAKVSTERDIRAHDPIGSLDHGVIMEDRDSEGRRYNGVEEEYRHGQSHMTYHSSSRVGRLRNRLSEINPQPGERSSPRGKILRSMIKDHSQKGHDGDGLDLECTSTPAPPQGPPSPPTTIGRRSSITSFRRSVDMNSPTPKSRFEDRITPSQSRSPERPREVGADESFPRPSMVFTKHDVQTSPFNHKLVDRDIQVATQADLHIQTTAAMNSTKNSGRKRPRPSTPNTSNTTELAVPPAASTTSIPDAMKLWYSHPLVMSANNSPTCSRISDPLSTTPAEKEQLRSQAARYSHDLEAAYQSGILHRPDIDWQCHLSWWATHSAALATSINADLSVSNFPAVHETELTAWRTFMDIGEDITVLEQMDFLLSVLWWQRNLRGLAGTVPFFAAFRPAQYRNLSETKAEVIGMWLKRQKGHTAWCVGGNGLEGGLGREEWYLAAPCEVFSAGGVTAAAAAAVEEVEGNGRGGVSVPATSG